MTVALVDDQVLGAVLRGSTPRALRRRQLATTGYWYVRLCQAVLTAAERPGTLAAPFASLPAAQRRRAVAALVELPDEIELLSLRTLAPDIGMLRQRHALNVLGTEALAAAIALDATVYLSTPSPLLEQALAAEGRPVHHVPST
ncbi:MAG TPA: hypothetical protein VM938_16350 [Acidimicrobiales bacterium]|nr:hypothetical protein [Acidimicrobiales bacterium]